MTDIQAALGISQLDRIDQFVSDRNEVARKYDAMLSGLPLQLPHVDPNSFSSFHLYVIRVLKSDNGVTQKMLYTAMQDKNIQVNLHYIPVYRQPFYKKMGFEKGYCPNAEKYFAEAISIPIFPGLMSDDQKNVAATIKLIINNGK